MEDQRGEVRRVGGGVALAGEQRAGLLEQQAMQLGRGGVRAMDEGEHGFRAK